MFQLVPGDASASPLLYNFWVNQANGVRASAQRKVPTDILVKANITRASGGVQPLSSKAAPRKGRVLALSGAEQSVGPLFPPRACKGRGLHNGGAMKDGLLMSGQESICP